MSDLCDSQNEQLTLEANVPCSIDKPFRATVPYLTRPDSHARDGRSVDEHAGFSLHRVRHHDAHAHVDALHVDRDDPVEIFLGDFNAGLLSVCRTRVVYDNVQFSEPVFGRLECVFPGLPFRYVDSDEYGGPAVRIVFVTDFGSYTLACGDVHICDEDMCAFSNESMRDRFSKSAPASGDNGYFSGESTHDAGSN